MDLMENEMDWFEKKMDYFEHKIDMIEKYCLNLKKNKIRWTRLKK